MAEVTITAATRTTLLELRKTRALLDLSAQRLSTGLKVASAADDPSAFFQAKGLTNRASALLSIKDDINLAVSSVKTALDTITSIDTVLDSMRALALTAKDTSNTDGATIAAQFDVLRAQIDTLVNDTNFEGKNLLKSSPDSLTVVFNENNTSTLTVTGIDSTVSALSIDQAVKNGADYDDFKDNSDVDDAVTAIDAAISKLKITASILGSNSDIITTRLDFTDNLITTLQEGAAKLVNADLNVEAANLLALQARNNLAVTTIGLTFPGGTTLTALLQLG